MSKLEGKRILITGPAGQIAFPLAARLAQDNEVWGIARFSDAAQRKRCDDAGIQTRAVDLADPDWGDLPEHVDHLLHLAAVIEPGLDFDRSIRINAESRKEQLSYGGKTYTPVTLTRHFGIRGFPSLAYLTSEGDLITVVPGFVPPETFLPMLKYIQRECYKQQMTFEEFMKRKEECDE